MMKHKVHEDGGEDEVVRHPEESKEPEREDS